MPENITFFGDLVVAIIGSIVGVIASVVYVYMKSKKGNHVILQRNSETPQISISPRVRQNLQIGYKGQQVDDIVLNILNLYNNGEDIKDPIEIKIDVSSDTSIPISFLELEKKDPLDKTFIVKDGATFILSRGFLNAKKAYPEEQIELTFFSNTKLKFVVSGGGKGWSARYQNLNRSNSIVQIKHLIGLLIANMFIWTPIALDNIFGFHTMTNLFAQIFAAFGGLLLGVIIIDLVRLLFIQKK